MKKFTNYIVVESYLIETFKEPHLREIAKQINDESNENQKKYKDDNWRHPIKNSFKSLFGKQWGWSSLWSSLTEKDLEIHENVSLDTAKEIVKRLKKTTKNPFNGIIFVQNPKTKRFVSAFLHANGFNDAKSLDYTSYGDLHSTGGRYSYLPDKVSYYSEYFEGKNLYLYTIDINKYSEFSNIVNSRAKSKSGMINKESYEEIAKQNIERYKRIIRQHHAEAQEKKNKEIVKKVRVLLNDIYDVAEDPNTDHTKSDIKKLMNYCGGIEFGSKEKNILYIFNTYLSLCADIKSNKGAYEFQERQLKDYLIKMNNLIDEARKLLEKIEA